MQILGDSDSDEESGSGSDDDSDEDVVLEAGPALVVKPADGVTNDTPTAQTPARREWRAEDLL